VYPISIKEG